MKKRIDMNPSWSSQTILLNARAVKRALVIHPFGLGDALFITPLLRSLKENGVGEIDLLVGSRTREIFETNPCVHQVFEWDKTPVYGNRARLKRWQKLARMFWLLWKKRYQVVIDCSPSAQYALLSFFLFWIPVRIGFRFRGRGAFLTHRVEIPDGFSKKPVAEYYFDLLRFFGVESSLKRTELFINDEDRTECGRILSQYQLNGDRSFIVVAPGGGESWGLDARLKRWPPAHFADLIRGLQRTHGSWFNEVAVLGAGNESPLAKKLVELLPDIPTKNLCGVGSIRAVTALMKRASCVIANDGGLAHLAHAVGVPTIVIYGPVDPVVYGPYPRNEHISMITGQGPVCRPCYQQFRYQAGCQGVECLNWLTAERVLARLQADRFVERILGDSVLK